MAILSLKKHLARATVRHLIDWGISMNLYPWDLSRTAEQYMSYLNRSVPHAILCHVSAWQRELVIDIRSCHVADILIINTSSDPTVTRSQSSSKGIYTYTDSIYTDYDTRYKYRHYVLRETNAGFIKRLCIIVCRKCTGTFWVGSKNPSATHNVYLEMNFTCKLLPREIPHDLRDTNGGRIYYHVLLEDAKSPNRYRLLERETHNQRR